jgi:hypothetical protein
VTTNEATIAIELPDSHRQDNHGEADQVGEEGDGSRNRLQETANPGEGGYKTPLLKKTDEEPYGGVEEL